MRSAKEIVVKPIPAQVASAFVAKHHYSGKAVRNSQLHFGVFLDGRLEGAIQLGPSLDKRKIMGLVRDTGWNGFLELNRMVFTDYLPRNSESRALGVVFRLIRKKYPQIKWIISFADACQCGDGTIYRASGFVLTAVKTNKDVIRLPDGTVTHTMSVKTGKGKLEHLASTGGASTVKIGTPLAGFQVRYIYFLDQSWRPKLAVPALPFSELDRLGAKMYLGEKPGAEKSAGEASRDASGVSTPEEGGSTPTSPLQSEKPGLLARAAAFFKPKPDQDSGHSGGY